MFSSKNIMQLMYTKRNLTLNDKHLINNAAKSKVFVYIRRSMYTRVTVVRGVTHMISIKPSTNTLINGYAVRSVNEADKLPDSLALKNNPPLIKNGKRHFECHRESCVKQKCEDKDCSKLCDVQKDIKAIAHMTHGKAPSWETDKTTVPVSSTDLDGNQKTQNAVVYKKAHKTSKTAEHIKGTQKLQNEPAMKNIIIQHEDKT